MLFSVIYTHEADCSFKSFMACNGLTVETVFLSRAVHEGICICIRFMSGNKDYISFFHIYNALFLGFIGHSLISLQ